MKRIRTTHVGNLLGSQDVVELILARAAARHGAENVFMNSASQGVVALFQLNRR